MMSYEAVIGLEIHVELKTKTKMFCYSLNDPNEKHPNINICPVCMGHPGTLPFINREAVRHVIRTGLALNGEIPEFSQFDRKNYFYPDLPKGYQISQYQHPLVIGGYLDIKTRGGGKRIRIRRIHLEEDTGRLIHDDKSGCALVDFNRAGVPLMELVTEPDFRSGEEVRTFGEELQKILRYLGASDADMEKGQMRVEVNISLRGKNRTETGESPVGGSGGLKHDGELGTKVEIKNINSFKFAADAVVYEIKRQSEVLESGEKVIQETRGWDETRGVSFSQRVKEESHDYRYFPEPDLPPLSISREWVEELRALLPELPAAKKERLEREYMIDSSAAEILSREKSMADFFEAAASEAREHFQKHPGEPEKNLSGIVASLMNTELSRLMRESSARMADLRITPENFGELASLFARDSISSTAAKKVLEEIFRSGDDPSDIIERLGLWQISGATDVEDIARHIVKENEKAAADYRAGNQNALQYLLGQIMKESRGRANPKTAGEILRRILSS
jgi:aspartyl-tRNA(Asn)/glutamyl-tRNA(Gln) amidotransferase subunit B